MTTAREKLISNGWIVANEDGYDHKWLQPGEFEEDQYAVAFEKALDMDVSEDAWITQVLEALRHKTLVAS